MVASRILPWRWLGRRGHQSMVVSLVLRGARAWPLPTDVVDGRQPPVADATAYGPIQLRCC